jgi:hypothetical protein
MTQTKRSFSAIIIFALVLFMLALSIKVAAIPSDASLVATPPAPVATIPQTLFYVPLAGNALPIAEVPHSGTVRFLIAQNEIPDVLVPSVVPPAVPTLAEGSPTPRPSIGSAKVSNKTTLNSTGSGFDVGRIVGSISPFFVIALIPLLFIIGALFYFFFMGDQDRGGAEEDQEADTGISNVDEDSGWKEL